MYKNPAMDDEEIKQSVDSIFQRFDRDKNDTLDIREAQDMLVNAFVTVNRSQSTPENIQKFMQNADKNGDGRISRVELFLLLKKKIS